MFSETLWIPGKRKLTNAMLSDLRAAGFYAGKAKAYGARRAAGNRDRFATETAAIRKLVADEAMRLGLRRRVAKVAAPQLFDVFVTVTGHPRHDPDAWYLLGKAAVDGLVDALVLHSDRKQINIVGGTVMGSGGQGFSLRLCESGEVSL